MEDKKSLTDDQLDEVAGGALANNPNGKKNLIRSLYDAGSELEIGEENEIVKFEKAVSDLFHPKK